MTVKRIVPNIATEAVSEVRKFYADVFDLDVVMDFGWIASLSSNEVAAPQISVASEGGAGTAVPDLSIEVEDVDAVYQRAKVLNCDIIYGITDEPWGVRRFYLIDPAGKVLNVLSHSA